MSRTIGIVREWKTECERRAPLVPADVKRLMEEEGLTFAVESSPHRIYPDEAYAEVGALVCDDLSSCDFLVGIKEMPMDRLLPGKPHLFFSHTIKGQPYNMPLLQRMLDLKCTLLDYELVKDDAGRRLIFFGRQAGQAGMINSLWTLGQRLEVLGHRTPFADLRQARNYSALKEALVDLKRAGDELKSGGMPAVLQPMVVVVTGRGHVARGAREVLEVLDPLELSAGALLEGAAWKNPDRVHVVMMGEQELYRKRDGGAFSKKEFRRKPELYEAAFPDYLDHVTVLVTGHFWDVRYPRLVSKQDVRRLFANSSQPRLLVIGDVSCDPEGGIEVTLQATYPDKPTFIYHPEKEDMTFGFEGHGLAVMAVEILPTELARDSSEVFSGALVSWLPVLARADYGASLEELDLPAPVKGAVIAHQGELAPQWKHLLS